MEESEERGVEEGMVGREIFAFSLKECLPGGAYTISGLNLTTQSYWNPFSFSYSFSML